MLSTLLGALMSIVGGINGEIVYAQEVEVQEREVVLIEVETEEHKIERLIREEFTDAPLMVEVARCESSFRNVPGRLSDDFGPFQVNYVHLETLEKMGLDRTKVEDNIKYARYLYDKNGLRDWENSKHCWSK